jgi:phospholipase C
MDRSRRRLALAGAAAALVLVPAGVAAAAMATAKPTSGGATTTPIQHLVVIFQENVSFDHYFGTYPYATNTSGQEFDGPQKADANTLANTAGLNGQGTLLTNNPNTDGSGNQVNPKRLDPANINDVLMCDQDHNYNDEQKAFDGGAMDKFVTTVGNGGGKSVTGQLCNPSDVMNYYDGNTVTALWNYAQQYAMSDNSFGTTFGPSSPGAINLIAGDTGGVGLAINPPNNTVPDGNNGTSLIGDDQPYYDDCSTRDAVSLTGQNVGDLLNSAGLSWGWFQGGNAPTTSYSAALAALGKSQPDSTFIPDEFKGKFAKAPASDQGLCNAVHPVGLALGGIGGKAGAGPNQYGSKDDYIPHHEPFNYYASTANPHHLAPASLSAIGTDTQTFTGGVPQFNTANHQYDMSDFDNLVAAITNGSLSPDHLPAVSFLKAPGYQDGHAAYSDPIDEQQFIVNEINALEKTPDWSSTAVVIAYDDSDGYYDHVYSGVHNPSNTAQDFLSGTGQCGNTSTQAPLGGENGRCGYGPRMPLLVVSPFAKHNKVDHTLTDQSSILKFVEDNWKLPRISDSFDAMAGTLNDLFNFNANGGSNKTLFLDPATGQEIKN